MNHVLPSHPLRAILRRPKNGGEGQFLRVDSHHEMANLSYPATTFVPLAKQELNNGNVRNFDKLQEVALLGSAVPLGVHISP